MPDSQEVSVSPEPAMPPPTTLPATRAEEPTPMLDVHPAHHAASSWREFFIHIATIVLGLLIAVGLEQTVEYVHHRRELTQARKDLAEEKETNVVRYRRNRESFKAGQARIETYLAQMRASLRNPSTPLPAFAMPLGFRYYAYTAWTTAQRSGALTLMPTDEQDENDRLYVSLHTLDERADQAYAQLEKAQAVFLADPNPGDLSHEQMLTLYRDLCEGLSDVQNFRDVEEIAEEMSPDLK